MSEGLLPSVSFGEGLRRCLGRIELYDRIARRFLDTRADDADRAKLALGAGQLEVLRKVSHDLTSTAGTLGAGRLSAAAQALQQGVDEGVDSAGLTLLLEAFALEHRDVVGALESYARGEVDLRALAERK
jgi:HPt (histidine-containing phosphotransfer) domain-containing protein